MAAAESHREWKYPRSFSFIHQLASVCIVLLLLHACSATARRCYCSSAAPGGRRGSMQNLFQSPSLFLIITLWLVLSVVWLGCPNKFHQHAFPFRLPLDPIYARSSASCSLFALLKNEVEKYCWLICCERKTLYHGR